MVRARLRSPAASWSLPDRIFFQAKANGKPFAFLFAAISTPHPQSLSTEVCFSPDDLHPACGHLLPLPRAKDIVRGGEGGFGFVCFAVQLCVSALKFEVPFHAA